MSCSLFDLFTIGIGPSSSHTVGPMRAARRFVGHLSRLDQLAATARVAVEIYGSLALTGHGHGTGRALVLGLIGERPQSVDIDAIDGLIAAVRQSQALMLDGAPAISFVMERDFSWRPHETLPFHTNGLIFSAHDAAGALLSRETYYSIGGGFVLSAGEAMGNAPPPPRAPPPHDFSTAAELLARGREAGLSIAAMVHANEAAARPAQEVDDRLEAIWQAMQACIDRGCAAAGVLPGGLDVPRRAPRLYRDLLARGERALADPSAALDWINLYALAVSEENAAGGRVVTAPTNGAAGILPAVLRYYERFHTGADTQGIRRFLLTATAIGALFKQNASISGADVGCQGEVGAACSMAAGGLTAALGGTNEQIENAAEIGMEHNLGLTCDPIAGLVQIPCIERNALAATMAVNAARLALLGDGAHMVSLDKVIETMRQTGHDMSSKYKETAEGGLAVNVPEC
jgi:L-serine dehydratase